MTLSKDMAIRMMINDKLREKKNTFYLSCFLRQHLAWSQAICGAETISSETPGGNPFWGDKRLIIIILSHIYPPNLTDLQFNQKCNHAGVNVIASRRSAPGAHAGSSLCRGRTGRKILMVCHKMSQWHTGKKS